MPDLERTPEGRLAAVAKKVIRDLEKVSRETGAGPIEPDTTDFREAFRPYMREQELLWRIDEARKTAATALTNRIQELSKLLFECRKEMPREDRW